MQKKKIMLIAGVALLSTGILVACSSNNSSSSSSTKTYSYLYSTDPNSLDYTLDNVQSTFDITANTIDGLLENDKYGDLIPSLAEDWKVSKDGLTYTYKLRKGVKWYTAEGEEYAEVTAHDFVTGLKHAADMKSQQLPLVQTSIVGLDDYVQGKTNDFSKVGVKAIDDYTVQYTLTQPESYWNSKTTSGILMPVNAEFLEAKGSDFGKVTPDGILYNGPFVVTSLTAKSSIEYKKNPNYWDKENVHIDNVKLSFFDGTDPESIVKNFSDGVFSVANLYPTSSTFAEVEKKYKENIRYGVQGPTTYFASFNIDRQTYNLTAKTDDIQKTSSKKALQNKDFRQALAFAFNRTSYLAQSQGEEGAKKALRSSLVPPTFVTIGEESFAEEVQKDLVSYGDEWQGVDLSDGQDSLYNPEKAKAEFAKAKSALEAEGVQFPIHLDVPVIKTSKLLVAQVQSFKQSLEETLGKENVAIDIQQVSQDELNNITYYAPSAKELDWDIHTGAGWSPDYQDPSTYLDILRTDVDGQSAITYLGIEAKADGEAATKVGLNDYNNLLKAASEEKNDTALRFKKYAAAQAWLTDSALVIPYRSIGASPVVSKVVPFEGAFAWSGIKGGSTFKYIHLQDDVVKTKDYEAARDKWNKERVEANAKAQEELANHVE